MAEPLTAERLAEIKARAEKATPGPWFLRDEGTFGEVLVQYRTEPHGFRFPVARAVRSTPGYAESAEFIAHARQDVPDLVAEVERLREENEELLEAIGTVLAETREPLTLGAVRDARDDLVRVYNAAKKRLARQRQEASHA